MKIDTDIIKKQLNEELYNRLERAYHIPTDSQYQAMVNMAFKTYQEGLELVLGIEKLVGKKRR